MIAMATKLPDLSSTGFINTSQDLKLIRNDDACAQYNNLKSLRYKS